MLQQFKILLLVLVFNLVHSNYENFESDSITSNDSCTESDETVSYSNCYCYNQPETEFEYSICAPKKCQQYRHNCKDPGYFLVQEKCFYLEKDKRLNFKEAKENCKGKGGKLYEPKDNDKMKEVLIKSGLGANWALIGIKDISAKASEGNYVYDSNNQTINFSPTFMKVGGVQYGARGISYNCNVVLAGYPSHPYFGKFYDNPCSKSPNPSICEL